MAKQMASTSPKGRFGLGTNHIARAAATSRLGSWVVKREHRSEDGRCKITTDMLRVNEAIISVGRSVGCRQAVGAYPTRIILGMIPQRIFFFDCCNGSLFFFFFLWGPPPGGGVSLDTYGTTT